MNDNECRTVKIWEPVQTVANMTLRDWYIGQALVGILAHQGLRGNPELQAQNACDMANLVMRAREEEP